MQFLRELSAHNEKSWFDAHRADYERYWLEPAKELVGAAGSALTTIAPVNYEAKVNGSIFRINRDIRFSADKRPYKDHLDFWFWEGERKGAPSGFFFRITPGAMGIGVGAHGFDKDRLARYRAALLDAGKAAALEQAVSAVEANGYQVHGEHYKRVPRGLEVSGEFAERMVRYAALWCGADTPVGELLHGPELVPHLIGEWRKQLPIHRWLVDELG